MKIQYFKLIIRDLIKRKGFSLINISGIALGFAVCIMTLLYVYTELSFDRHIPGVENKYRIVWGPSDDVNAILPYPFLEKLSLRLPEGAQTCLVRSIGDQYLSHDKKDYKFENILFSDPGFLPMFGLSLLQGDTAHVLNAPLQILLSEKTAARMFGQKDPVGETVRLWMKDFTVKGVFHGFPGTSSQRADAVISILSWKNMSPGNLTSWGNKSYDYYLSLPSTINTTEFQNKIKATYLDADPGFRDISEKDKATIGFQLEPITNIHLRSGHVLWDGDKNKGDFNMIIVFIFVGILILLMAGFNYINLSTAYFQTKNTFSGIQKVMGANARNLVNYLFIQTSVIVIAGFIFSLLLLMFFIPYFNQVVSRQISFSLIFIPQIAGVICLVVLSLIFLSGIYPAVRFSQENPVFALKRKISLQNSFYGLSVRKLLVIMQFVISMALISGVLIMGRQIKMMSSQKLGFNAEQLIETNSRIDKKHFELFKTKLEAIPGVAAVSASSNTPAGYINNENPFRLTRENKEKDRDGSSVVGILPNYFDVMNIRLLEGEPFSPSMEKQQVAILSKTAVNMLGLSLSEALNEQVHLGLSGKDYTITGIAEDVQYRSLREVPKPVVYVPNYNNYRKSVIRLAKGNHTETIAAIKKAWHSISPDVPFDFNFFDTKIQSNYTYEISILHLLNILVFISIIISSLGIFGLIMEMTVQRTKEIGIRKVNGAKISEILAMLNKDFIKWVLIAFVIATPIAYYSMNKWLENFAYKTNLSWWIFALSGLLALGIALLTVSFQSWKAATRNPVEALRYE